MPQQVINIGTVAGDGTGDTLRESQRKANENFSEIYTRYAPNLGVVVPTDTPSGTGINYWECIVAGTYTNFGGVVLGANSRGTIFRNLSGVFSISQVAYDITSKVNVSDVVNTLVSTETAKPLSAAQGKVLQDGKVNVSDVINTLVSTETAKPLSANQGKSLNDKIALNTYSLSNKADLVTGKNKFNKDDTTTLVNQYRNFDDGLIYSSTGTYTTHLIPIKAGQTLSCNNAVSNLFFAHTLFDINKVRTAMVCNQKFITATVDGYCTFSFYPGGAYPLNLTQVEEGVTITSFVAYKLTVAAEQVESDVLKVNVSDVVNTLLSTETAKPLSAAQGKLLNEKFEDYAKVIDLDLKADLVAGKNKFNKDDATTLVNFYRNFDDGLIYASTGNYTTHLIPIKAGQTLSCNSAVVNPYFAHTLFDVDGVLTTMVCNQNFVTAVVDGFCTFSFYPGVVHPLPTTQVEEGVVATAFEAYELGIDSAGITSDIARAIKYTEITAKRIGTSGVDADFCGLNAIGDAMASITDASETNRYKIVCSGHFLFTLQTELIHIEPFNGEGSIINGKNWIDVEGMGRDETVLSVELAVGQTFTGGKTYSDFQPVMWNSNGRLSNMSIIGKNCRYALHIDAVDTQKGNTSNFENLYLNFKGAQGMGGTAGNCIGTGMGVDQAWNFRNCEIETNGGGAFAMHTTGSLITLRGGVANFYGCTFIGNLNLDNYPVNNIVYNNFYDCNFNKTQISFTSGLGFRNKLADYSKIKVRCSSSAIPVYFDSSIGRGLRVKSKSTGVGSTVKFSESSTAFNSIIGFSTNTIESKTVGLNKTQYGYQWKTGGVGLSGYAIGGLDIDSTNTWNGGLGVMLGNCATVNKTLTIIVDGTTYNVVFNENFTAQNNAYVIAKITAIIGTVADVDAFDITSEYYPEFSDMAVKTNTDSSVILAGMGVIFTNDGMRKAYNSDNRIDGICLYDTVVGEKGRIIKKGQLYTYSSGQRFRVLEDASAYRPVGTELGISATDGMFSASATPKVLRAVEENVFKIL
jgi:hypothetical protein